MPDDADREHNAMSPRLLAATREKHRIPRIQAAPDLLSINMEWNR